MDDRLARALEHSNYKVALATARKNLLLRFQNDLLHSCDGGVFTVTQTLIVFVRQEMERGPPLSIVLIDDKQNPVSITDPKQFLADIEEVYHTARNRYYFEFRKLSKARSVKDVVGL